MLFVDVRMVLQAPDEIGVLSLERIRRPIDARFSSFIALSKSPFETAMRAASL
jgi:hypothetical protein